MGETGVPCNDDDCWWLSHVIDGYVDMTRSRFRASRRYRSAQEEDTMPSSLERSGVDLFADFPSFRKNMFNGRKSYGTVGNESSC